MKKYLSLLLLTASFSCQQRNSVIGEHVTLNINTDEENGVTKASAMPEIKAGSELMNYKMRFDYLLMNISEMHRPEKTNERAEIWGLYPDTIRLKNLYMEKFIKDKKLEAYFEETAAPILHTKREGSGSYTKDELMDVASKFFYCDMVGADTNVQSHVCIGLNGIGEAKWEKDYTLLAAFCYEAIFSNFDKDPSPVRETYHSEKQEACTKFKERIVALDKYLLEVRQELFDRMKNSATLKKELLKYYELNRDNLAFRIVD